MSPKLLSDWLYGKELPAEAYFRQCSCGCGKLMEIEDEEFEIEAAICINSLLKERDSLRAEIANCKQSLATCCCIAQDAQGASVGYWPNDPKK